MADTLDRDAHGVVDVTIRDVGESRPDPERLQRDLARLGMPVRVYQGDPNCPGGEGRSADMLDLALKVVQFESAGGKFTASIHAGEIPTGHTLLIVFPVAPSEPGADEVAFDVIAGTPPDCMHMPAPGARAEEYDLGDDGRVRWIPPNEKPNP